VGNAIKFTENGEILLQVVSYRGSEEELELQFSVKDTGIGIPHDKLDAIFKAFAQADVSTTRRYGGTGLGLSICSRLVSMMGGSLWVESEPGEGSNFHFTTTCNIMNGAWEPLGAGAPDIRGKSVLILDDNATNRKILEQMVRGWGMLPQLAASAREALELLDRTYKDGRHFDVILSDVHMPDQDGFEFLEELARKPYRDELGVVMMLTSAALSGDAKRCKDLGASSYLIKPIGEEQLLSTVLSHLDAAHFEQMRVQSSPRARRTLQPAARPRDVLLVEDNLINQTVGIALLETCGHRVTVASNGGEAVEAASRHRFDAVLMDLQMPDMDGLEATRLIRNLDGPLARVPIFALTAHVTEDHRQDCLKGGMDGFLTKPIQEDSILALLETLPRTRASQ
ncbi:MAG: response regulator, partial [Armatimonadetes bacterium]|nr:response regulator [Armatimonadota bacterium]